MFLHKMCYIVICLCMHRDNLQQTTGSGTSALWSLMGLSQSDHNSEVTLTVNMLTEASWDLEKCHIEQVNHM